MFCYSYIPFLSDRKRFPNTDKDSVGPERPSEGVVAFKVFRDNVPNGCSGWEDPLEHRSIDLSPNLLLKSLEFPMMKRKVMRLAVSP